MDLRVVVTELSVGAGVGAWIELLEYICVERKFPEKPFVAVVESGTEALVFGAMGVVGGTRVVEVAGVGGCVVAGEWEVAGGSDGREHVACLSEANGTPDVQIPRALPLSMKSSGSHIASP